MQLVLGRVFASRKTGPSVLPLLIALALSSANAIDSHKSRVRIDSLERSVLDAYRRAAAFAGDGFIREAREEYSKALQADTAPVEFNLCVNRFREGPGHLPLGGSQNLAKLLSDGEEARAGLEKKISAWFLLASLMSLEGMTAPWFNRQYATVGEVPNLGLIRCWIDGNRWDGAARGTARPPRSYPGLTALA